MCTASLVLCPSRTKHTNYVLTFALGDIRANSEADQVFL